MKKQPKILALDIETAPHTAHVWGLFKETINLARLLDTGRVLCFSWKWVNEPGNVSFCDEREGRSQLLDKAHGLLDEADIVVSYNGKSFDLPTLNKEFLEHGYPPPSPYKQVDLYRTARANFRFASNKMDHLAKQLGIKTKIRHNGHELWIRCMEGDPIAWKKMERYNKRDVLILDKLYHRMLPWIKDHPNVAMFADGVTERVCPSCGSNKIHSRGTATTRAFTYIRYHCSCCGAWSRDRLKVPHADPPRTVRYA